MKLIGLVDVDFYYSAVKKRSKYPNLALMKISSYYKNKGFKVNCYSELFYDDYYKIFASKVFTFTSIDINLNRDKIICGGTGFGVKIKLKDKIEHIYPDYSLYNIDYAMGFITRGCIRNCGFCIVPQKEGMIRKNTDLDEFCNEQKKVRLLDNNILAYKNHLEELKKLKESEKQIDFTQGLDIRLINDKNAKIIIEINMWNGERLKFAFDDVKLEKIIEKKLDVLKSVGIDFSRIMFYVLIGFNSNEKEDLRRIEFLRKRRIDPYVMPYNKNNPYQILLSRYVNNKKVFWSKTWNEYLKLDDNKCRWYYKDYIKNNQNYLIKEINEKRLF